LYCFANQSFLFGVVPAARLSVGSRSSAGLCNLLEIRAVILESGALVLAYISLGRPAISRRFCDRLFCFIDSASDCA
jgi:hypothetical protein